MWEEGDFDFVRVVSGMLHKVIVVKIFFTCKILFFNTRGHNLLPLCLDRNLLFQVARLCLEFHRIKE
jgi:hypothetical protein